MKHTPALDQLAKRYVWWQPTLWAYQHPDIFLSNVMNLGSWDDIQLLQANLSPPTLKAILKTNLAGQFSQRSWDYWHYKLGYKKVPPLPKRNLS